MKESFYEPHVFHDQKLPIIFHKDKIDEKHVFMPHWHENIELLYFINGITQVTLNAMTFNATVGDLVVVNSNSIHHLKTLTKESDYYCLIVDKKLCEDFIYRLDQYLLQSKVSDHFIGNYFDGIEKEFLEKRDFYKSEVKVQTMALIVYLYRNYIELDKLSMNAKNSKINIAKQAIHYIQKYYSKPISTDDIAKELGFSKYYLCHIFKEATDYSLVTYLNLFRCLNAKKLLQTENFNVGEVMSLCGFENLSYFTRTYKKYIGILPSKEKQS